MSRQRIHILGICGTFMGSLALLARECGFAVSGSDANVYPPMSEQLELAGIKLIEGYHGDNLSPRPDEVIVGNALSRGNPAVEFMLNAKIPYTSGPEWLADHILGNRQIIAVAGTHGKTSTASMLAWILEAAGREPGFLIGGVPKNFDVSARLGKGETFVVEADEYDTAFFDKRSKFVHYRPEILILNNLEYDHADIFPDLDAIKRQFHHLVRTVPGRGTIIANVDDAALSEVLAMGCWSELSGFSLTSNERAAWRANQINADGSVFEIDHEDRPAGRISWNQSGHHNVANGLAAIAAAGTLGIKLEAACTALAQFEGVKRRLERYSPVNNIFVYDDFAHHPTAIRATLAGLRARVGAERILLALEPRSNSMRAGAHATQLLSALESADKVYLFSPPDLKWDAKSVVNRAHGASFDSLDTLLDRLCLDARAGDHVVFMSNGGFGGIRERFLEWLKGQDEQ